ncbi:MAG: CBS domain-containing protein [Alphaproteobacteria bacterium]|nr:CBS domain-containing protein [Alphaproteobacteria bacterium]
MRQAADIVRDQRPLALPRSASVRDACRAMRARHVGDVLVVDAAGTLAGIFTGRDAVCRVLAEGLDPAATTIADVMTRDPDAIAPGCDAVELLRRMRDGGYRHLPVVDGGRVVGIVSRGDLRGLEHARLDEETGLWERM